jgi:phosphoribosylglycinamide formyltransferase 1
VTRVRLAILISGRGSNMRALLEAAEAPDYPATCALVVSNNPEAGGLEVARGFGIRAMAIDHRAYKGRAAFEAVLDEALGAAGIEFIALAGFMRILTPEFTQKWAGRMINIHPSLLPLYPGLHTHRRALDAGDLVAGCTVHHVTAGVDEGEILGQAEIDIRPGDTENVLAARVLLAEHALYPRCLAAAIRGERKRRGETIEREGVEIRIDAP